MQANLDYRARIQTTKEFTVDRFYIHVIELSNILIRYVVYERAFELSFE